MVWGGKLMGAIMWCDDTKHDAPPRFDTRFWIFYRFYWDFDTFIFGHATHFEHEEHSDGHAAEHH